MLKIAFLFLAIIFALPVYSKEMDLIFTPQRSFFSAAQKGLGDAGIAFPSGISSGILNPALVNVYRKEIRETHGSVCTGFGRDSLYNKLILPLGVSYSADDGSAALFYRRLSSDSKLSHNEFIFNLSGMISPGSQDQGAVDFGVNFRLESIRWNNRELDPLFSVTRYLDTIHSKKNDTAAIGTLPEFRGELKQTNLILDIGFFQSRILPNINFGLTLRNITGYSWRTAKPFIRHVIDTLNDSVTIDSMQYINDKQKKGQWLHRKYRTLSTGIAWHADIKPHAFTLILPLDLEILGLFDKKLKNVFVFKGGVEAHIVNRFSLRLGYSRAPGILMKGFSQFKNLNFFTGGGGVHIDPIVFDFYISHNVFGTMLSFDY
ncbi:MAG TPA: hypothetical protein VHO70_12325 [Chitinispirillaceae bacterium]|nr:hypothetical protein [Chitinispirillaceae bacterium]